jgi:glucokinase
LAEKLSSALGLNVKVEKDTNAAVLCESVFGKGKDSRVVTYITISTGVGSATAIDKKVVWGGNCAAGEIGHINVERDGLDCPCGSKGCLELYASGTGIANIATQKFGKEMSAKEAFALAKDNNATALEIIKNAADKLGYAISCVYQLIDPDMIVLGGSVTKDYGILKPYLLDAINRYTQKVEGREFKIEISDYDGEQVLLGAAYYGSI